MIIYHAYYRCAVCGERWLVAADQNSEALYIIERAITEAIKANHMIMEHVIKEAYL